MLYDALAGRATEKPARFQEPPTAPQVFAAWNVPGASFHCQEFSFLYVALARASGLRAYHVLVEEDCHGMELSHACAAVFIQGRSLLVDLAYSFFGAPHKRFKALDDVEAAAVYLCGAEKLQACQIASKLAPGLYMVQATLFDLLVREDHWPEARKQMGVLGRVDTRG